MTALEDIQQAVLAREERTLSILRQTLALDTTVPPGRNYAQMADLLEPLLSAAGLHTERVLIPDASLQLLPHTVEGERVNLVARLPQAGAEPVTLYAHMDTGVSVGLAEGQWIHDPFAGELDNGRVYGVGVSDVKACMASLLTALEVIAELRLQPRFDIVCLFTTDKHIGIYPGLRHLAQEGYVKGHIVALAGMQDAYDIVGSAGKVNVSVRTRGKAATSRQSQLGLNALEAMAPILGELLTLKAKVTVRQSSLPDFRLPGAPATPLRSKFNMNVLRAGDDPDMVPDACTLIINRRTIPEEGSEDVIKEIAEAVHRGGVQSEGLRAEVSAVEHYPAARFDLSQAHRPRLRRVFHKVQGYDPVDWIEVARGASDLTFAVQELGCEVIHIGAARIGESTGDAAEDCVRLRDLHAHTRELVHYLTD